MPDVEHHESTQKPVTAIPRSVAYGAAIGVPAAAIVVVGAWGRTGAEVVLIVVALCLALMAVVALVSYMLATGQFPPRIGRADVQLPASELADTGQSLDYLQQSVVEIVHRLERLEDQVQQLAAAGDSESSGEGKLTS